MIKNFNPNINCVVLFDGHACPGFGDVCMENFHRYPRIETLESALVRPGNVKKLSVDPGVNPIVHDVRVNYSE